MNVEFCNTMLLLLYCKNSNTIVLQKSTILLRSPNYPHTTIQIKTYIYLQTLSRLYLLPDIWIGGFLTIPAAAEELFERVAGTRHEKALKTDF